MADPILGYGALMYMHDGGSYKLVLCAESCTFTRSAEIIETTHANSGLFKSFKKRRESWTADATGVTKIENDTALTFFYLLQTSVRNVAQLWKFVFTDPDGASKQISGSVIIGDETITGPAGDFAKASIQFIGTGAFAVSDVDPPAPDEFDVLSDYWQTMDGQNYISGASSGEFTGVAFTIADTDEIIDVDVEGTGYNHIQGTPAAGSRECHYDSATDRLNFPSDLIFDGNQRVFVEIKRPV